MSCGGREGGIWAAFVRSRLGQTNLTAYLRAVQPVLIGFDRLVRTLTMFPSAGTFSILRSNVTLVRTAARLFEVV